MATIDDIIAKLQAIPIQGDGSLSLTPGDFDIDFIDTFFTQVVGVNTLQFQNASKVPGTGSFTVTGEGDYLGYTGITLTLSFTTQDDQVVATLDGTFDKGKVFPLPVVTWISISNAGLTTTISQPYNIVNFIFHANIQVSGSSGDGIPIEIGTVDQDNWRIDIADGSTQPVTAEQLVALLSANTLDSFVPDSLVQLLDGLTINDLHVVFDTTEETVSQFYLGLTVTNAWPITSKVALEAGLNLALTMNNPTDATTRETVGQVTGTFMIDGVPVPVFVQADVSSNSTNWIVGLDPRSSGVTLPSFSSLIELAGGDSFVATLPSGLKDIPQINISKLQVDFSLSPASLQLLTFAAATTSPWPIIDGFLTIQELSFELDLLNLTSQTSPQIGGQLGSTFAISDAVSLYFVIQKDPASSDWTLTGGLPPGQSVNLTDLVGKLLSSFVTLPANAPAINLNTLNTTVVPGSSMSFTAGSTSPWSLVPNELAVDSFTLQFTYNEQATQNKFAGSLAATLTIAAVSLNLVTALDTSGNWKFAGGTAAGQTVQIGDLIADLSTKFGIPSVPAPIASLVLTSLNVSYDSGTGNFTFDCVGDFEVSDTNVTLNVNISVTATQPGDQNKPGTIAGTKGYSATFTGQVTFADLTFVLVFNTQSTGTNVFVASYSAASAASGGGGSTPPGTINLHDLVADVSTSLAASIPTDIEIDLKDVKFIFLEQQTKQFSFGLDLSAAISLADIPLVGDKLPQDVTLAINNLQFTYNSLQFTTDQANLINPLLPSTVSQLPATGLPQGMILAADLQLGQEPTQHLAIGGQSTSSQTASPSAPSTALTQSLPGPVADQSAGATPTTKWFDIQKQFGIFQFNRIGISYQSGVLLFSLDAGMSLGPLTFSMDGLSIGSELSAFDPVFDLRGLGLSYASPPLLIAGALLKLAGDQLAPGVQFQFDGAAVVEAENFGLAAIGSYAQLTSGDPSLFVYAQLLAPLGGPAAFFVTGLMLGFGFNRGLAIPAQDEVASFPLLLLAQPPGPGQPALTPGYVLQVLEGQAAAGGVQQAWIQPQPGSYWIAVGLQFTSFELVTSNALLIVEFGHDFQIVMLGLSTMRLPQGAPNAETYAYVELQLMAVFRPQDGFFGLTAVLTSNSYVIAPACHLTGGFAFYLWFGSNPNAGQFVITLGGYHPAFNPPAYFPQESRLGFNWAVSSQVSVQGDAYFALTTSCVMAGGGLQVLFQDGDLRAWFTAQADFILSWNPFFFTAQIEVDIGVSYRLNLLFCHKTISVSIGASVNLWGPPTGGYVHVHLVVVSFTVNFGSGSASQNNNPLQWPDFKSLIPATGDVCKITLSSGMYKSQDDPGGISNSQKLWIVRAKDFAFFTQSSIPASNLQTSAPTASSSAADVATSASANYTNDNGPINIRPMNLTGVTSTHTLSIYYMTGGTVDNPVWSLSDVTAWDLQPSYQNVPDSLWGAPPSPFTQIPGSPTANVIPNQMVGYAAGAPSPEIGTSRGLVPLTALAEELITPAGATPLTSAITSSPDYVATFNDLTVAQIEQVMQANVQQSRDAIYSALNSAGIYSGTNGPLTVMAATAGDVFSDSPLQQL